MSYGCSFSVVVVCRYTGKYVGHSAVVACADTLSLGTVEFRQASILPTTHVQKTGDKRPHTKKERQKSKIITHINRYKHAHPHPHTPTPVHIEHSKLKRNKDSKCILINGNGDTRAVLMFRTVGCFGSSSWKWLLSSVLVAWLDLSLLGLSLSRWPDPNQFLRLSRCTCVLSDAMVLCPKQFDLFFNFPEHRFGVLGNCCVGRNIEQVMYLATGCSIHHLHTSHIN